MLRERIDGLPLMYASHPVSGSAHKMPAVLPRVDAICGTRGRLPNVPPSAAAVAAGAELLQPAEVTGLRRVSQGHVGILEDGREIAANTVIAACGSWNAKGPFMVGDVMTAPSDLFAFKAHFQLPPRKFSHQDCLEAIQKKIADSISDALESRRLPM